MAPRRQGANGEGLRVAYVVARFPVPSEQFIVREVEALRELGLRIEVAVMHPRGWVGVDVAAAIGAICSSPLRGCRTLQEAWRLRWADKRPFAILRSAMDALRLAPRLRRLEPDLVHGHFVNASATTARLVACWLRVPWGASAHARDIWVEHGRMEQRLATASHVITCSDAAAAWIRDRVPAELHARIHRVYHGIPPVPAASRVLPRGNLIVAAGRFVAKKGFTTLIEALSMLARRNVAFTARLVGEGRQLGELAELAGRRELGSRLQIDTWKSQSELGALLRQAAVVVVPSVVDPDGDRDNIPNVLLEALANGTPVIASALPSIVEINEAGAMALVRPGEAQHLAEALERVLASAELRRRMSEKGRELVGERFGRLANGARLLEIFGASCERPFGWTSRVTYGRHALRSSR